MDAPGSGRVQPGDREVELRAVLADCGLDPDTLAGDGEIVHHAAAVASDMVLARGAEFSARQVAARSGVPLDRVVRMFHHLGIAVTDLDAPAFSAPDIEVVRRLGRAPDLGIYRGDDLLRVIAGALERITEAAVAVYVQGPERDMHDRAATVAECARTNMLATELALEVGAGLGPLLRHHMRQAVARQRVIQEGVSRPELARLAIGFVDLVGSTAMQASLDPAALGEQVNRFESRAFDVTTARGGRIVKFIGDEIMVAAADPTAGVHIVGDLVEAFTADGTQPRGGLVYGEVLFRHGDYYGRVVNLASRLVDTAIPGEALVDGSVVVALKDEEAVRFESAGRRMLKGFDAPVAVWSLVRES
jgi:class 3 adenylate cyclase